MDSWHTLLITWSSSRTFALISSLRLLQKLLMRLHDILFHRLKSQLSSVANRNRHYWSRGSHARCFPLLATLVFNPAIYFGLYLPSNLSLDYCLILFPFQKAFRLPFVVWSSLWFTLDFLLVLILLWLSAFWDIVVISLWLARHRPLTFSFFGTWFEKTLRKGTFWGIFSRFLLLLLCLFYGFARIILLSLLEVFSVFLLGNYLLWVFVRSNSLIIALLPHCLWSIGLLRRTFWHILAQSLLNHIFKVVFRRDNLTI
jgi:hypothetical protein